MKDFSKTEIAKQVAEALEIKNPMAVPKLTKIVINAGMGSALSDSKVLDRMANEMQKITGQKPAVTRAKQSISTFKLRSGDKIGLKVTLRGIRMYDFLQKMINVVLPRLRDFRGVSLTAFDQRGNYSLGLTELSVFPEIDYAQLDKLGGLEITFVNTATNPEGGKVLMEKLGIPFEKEEKK